MKKMLVWIVSAIALVVGAGAFVWFVNPFDIRTLNIGINHASFIIFWCKRIEIKANIT